MRSNPILRPIMLSVLVAANGLSGCASAVHGTQSNMEASRMSEPLTVLPAGTRWRLLESKREALRHPDAARVILQIDDGRLYGDSGCNRYSAGYAIDPAGQITLQPLVSTKRGCVGAAGTIEKHYYEALQSLQSIHHDGDALSLQLADGDALRFVAAPPETE